MLRRRQSFQLPPTWRRHASTSLLDIRDQVTIYREPVYIRGTMVRCYIYDSQCTSDDEVFVCEHCGISCYRHCMEEYDTDVCPKCVGEPMLGAIEF